MLNPQVFGSLGPLGAHVVVAHEATHAATHAAAVSMPLWVAEGFADYVGIGSVQVPIVRRGGRRAARRTTFRAAVGRCRPMPPSRSAGAGLEASYEEAWLATSLIAKTYGQPRLVAFYRLVEAHPDALEAAFEDVLQTSQPAFTACLAQLSARAGPCRVIAARRAGPGAASPSATWPGDGQGSRGDQRLPPATGWYRVFRRLALCRPPGRRRRRLHGADARVGAGGPRAAYPVVRDRSRMLLPTRRVARAVQLIAAEHGCDRVVFGASAPFGLLAGGLRAAGVRRMVAITHGHEVWWSAVPGARRLLRRIGREVDVLTYVSDYCRGRIATALRRSDAEAMVRMSPGVDPDVFRPGQDGAALRRRLRIGDDQPVVLAASRLVARKGHDILLEAWPRVRAAHPSAVLRRRRRRPGAAPTGAPRRGTRASAARSASSRTSAWVDMPAVYAAGDVFAMPCRTRLGGLEPEALGIVFLEAAACGLPVVVGASGGAPETVVHGETGYVVDPRSPAKVATAICALLADPAGGAAMGSRGRDWVRRAYSPEAATRHASLALLSAFET